MDDIEGNMRVQEAQLTGLDHRQDDSKGNIRAYEARVNEILTTIVRHEEMLKEKYSRLTKWIGRKGNEENTVQQDKCVDVILSSSKD